MTGGETKKVMLESNMTFLVRELGSIPKTHKVMDKYVCIICGYIYDPAEGDPESGIAPGTAFEDIPEDWTCPACGVGKEHFEKYK